jgi:GABA permease
MRNYLVIANQTVVSETVVDKVRDLTQSMAARFHIVVPATRVQEGLTWTEGAARALARRRLELAMVRFGQMQVHVTGEVGDENPVLAAMDALRERQIDEVLLCTLPSGVSGWLKQDLPNRLRRRISLPVTHLPIPRLAPVERLRLVDTRLREEGAA